MEIVRMSVFDAFLRKHFPLLARIQYLIQNPNLDIYDMNKQVLVPRGQNIYDPDVFGLYDLKTQRVAKKIDSAPQFSLDFSMREAQRYVRKFKIPILSDRYDLVLRCLYAGDGICLDACTSSPLEKARSRVCELGYSYVPIDIGGDGASVRKEDLTKLGFETNSVSSIISLDTMEHIEDYPKALSELYRVLKENGQFIIHVPCYYFDRQDSQKVDQGKDPWGHVRYFSAVELVKNMVGVGFIILRLCYHLDYGAILCIGSKNSSLSSNR